MTKIMPLSKMNLCEFGVDERFLAHAPKESLREHSDLTYKYFENIKDAKKLENIIDDLIKSVAGDDFELVKQMFEFAIYLHDIGKINPYFQAKKMKNPEFAKFLNQTNSTKHSELSAEIYIDYFKEKISKISDQARKFRLYYILFAFSFTIHKHHGKIIDFRTYIEKFDETNKILRYFDKLNIKEIELFILTKLLFSLLISADYYATVDYMSGIKTNEFGIISNSENLKQAFESQKIIKNIRKKVKHNDINDIRSEIFLEAENSLLENIEKNIFYLEAPTGSGKTINSLNLAMQIINKTNANKIFYIFPFNTLVEQTKDVIEQIFSNSLKFDTINSISPIKEENQEDEESKYEKAYLSRVFFHNELLLISHAAFFNVLFGVNKENNFAFWQIANSVVIIDEIQSYDNNLWHYMVYFFKYYAKFLNIKFIIMSATLPKLDKLLVDANDEFYELLKNKHKFYQNAYFKNRVKLDFSLLQDEVTFEILDKSLKNEIQNYNKILFEFIKKKTAREFFEFIKDDDSYKKYEIHELSGDDNKASRERIISKSKEKNIKLIIVATQVIEAGVDIDMDLGFKDSSALDSEEQFLGRLNRSAKKTNAKAYFFNLDNASKIYKNDNRLEFNLNDKKYQKYLENKEFEPFYDEVLEKIRYKSNLTNHLLKRRFDSFKEEIQELNFRKIKEEMKLIKTNNFRLYFPFKIDLKEFDIDIKNIDEFLTDDLLDGEKIWQSYKELNLIKNYAKMKIDKLKLNSLMDFFTFNVAKFENQKFPLTYDEEFGGFFYIKNYERFIKNGKFDRNAYNDIRNSDFL